MVYRKAVDCMGPKTFACLPHCQKNTPGQHLGTASLRQCFSCHVFPSRGHTLLCPAYSTLRVSFVMLALSSMGMCDVLFGSRQNYGIQIISPQTTPSGSFHAESCTLKLQCWLHAPVCLALWADYSFLVWRSAVLSNSHLLEKCFWKMVKLQSGGGGGAA